MSEDANTNVHHQTEAYISSQIDLLNSALMILLLNLITT